MITRLRKTVAKHPTIPILIYYFLVELLFQNVSFSNLFPDRWGLLEMVDRLVVAAILLLIVLFFMKNNLKEVGFSAKNLKSGLRSYWWIAAIALGVHMLGFLKNIIEGKGHFMQTPDEIFTALAWVLVYLSAGIFEEVAYRIIPINILRNKVISIERKYMWFCVGISSFFFGALHLMNIVGGGDTPAQAIGRAIQCIGGGLIYGAIYWETGSAIVVIIFHFLWDVGSVFPDHVYIVSDATASMPISPMMENVAYIVMGILVLILNVVIARYILRKKKYKECQIEAVTMREQFLK